MRKGTEFEVTKEEYERAKAGAKDKTRSSYYMSGEDIPKHFSESIVCGYGLYDCQIREENGKYICSYWTGDSCD